LQQKLAEAFAGAGIALPPPAIAARSVEEADEHDFDAEAALDPVAAARAARAAAKAQRGDAGAAEQDDAEDEEAAAKREAAAAARMMLRQRQAGKQASEPVFGELLPAPRLNARLGGAAGDAQGNGPTVLRAAPVAGTNSSNNGM